MLLTFAFGANLLEEERFDPAWLLAKASTQPPSPSTLTPQTVNTVVPMKGFENGKTENLNSYDLESVSSQLVFTFSIIFSLICSQF